MYQITVLSRDTYVCFSVGIIQMFSVIGNLDECVVNFKLYDLRT
jgi:hypothetical protein